MQLESLADTIVAVSTAWQPAPLGIVRLSGPRAFELAASLLDTPPAAVARPGRAHAAGLAVPTLGIVPATLLTFRGPHSYSGQDLVELHLPGSLPLLRAVCRTLIERGARRAQPGEFTARAYIHGRLDARQVDAICALIHARSASTARQAARVARGELPDRLGELRERLLDLLARVEAGIDFADEEDVRFIEAAELTHQAASIRDQLDALRRAARGELHDARPHVALAGLPNAGKSTLFNALLGTQRVIVSPIVGTTRDVIEAELSLAGLRLVLQDCAGFGSAGDELEAETRLAAEQAAGRADLVLWVHEVGQPWTKTEREVLARIEPDRRIAVLTKIDRGQPAEPAIPFVHVVPVSARTRQGLTVLREAIVSQLEQRQAGVETALTEADALGPALGALDRVLEHLNIAGESFGAELVAADLRSAIASLGRQGRFSMPEEVLGRIFSQFCVGK